MIADLTSLQWPTLIAVGLCLAFAGGCLLGVHRLGRQQPNLPRHYRRWKR